MNRSVWSDPGSAFERMYTKGSLNLVHSPYDKDIREKIGPYLVPVGRTAIGMGLGVVLSMIGIAVAWSLFIFFGFQSLGVWLGSLFFGAGLGAGTGAFVSWLHVDRENGMTLLLTAAVVLGSGIAGAWGGFEYGSTVEVECCAMPTAGPVYYTALGSAVLANAGAIAFAAARAFLTRKRPTQFHNAVH